MRFKSILLTSTMAFSALFADYGQGMDQTQDGQQKLCPNYGKNRIGSMYTEGYGPFVTGEFLYWTSQMDGLDFAYSQTRYDNITGSITGSIDIARPSFDWDPALRVGLGYYFNTVDWSVKLEWTRLRSDVRASKARADGFSLNSLWGRPSASSTLVLEDMKSHWDFAYDVLDLTLRPGFFRYQCFAIQPEFGLRGAWIDWKYDIDSIYEDDDTILSIKQNHKNDFNAIGLVARTNMKWFMGWGFNIYANALASVLYGKFDVEMPSTILFRDITLTQKYHDEYWRVRSNVHLAIGLEWERFFMNNGMRLNIHAGYEFLSWFNQNQLQRLRVVAFNSGNQGSNFGEIYPVIERDDLSISGLTVGAGLEF